MATKPIPDGYHTLTPYFAVENAAEAIEYYTHVFEAKERVRMDGPDGKVAHAELEIGDSLLMLSDPFAQSDTKSPKELGGTTGGVFMYVEDVDAVVNRAIDAGATLTMEVADQFWGDAPRSEREPIQKSGIPWPVPKPAAPSNSIFTE